VTFRYVAPFEDLLKPRSLFTLIALIAAVPAVIHPVFAKESARGERHIFEIGPHTIGDTKVVITAVGGQDRP
jgi:hypothetical protein